MLANQIKSIAERYLDHCSILDSRYRIIHKLGEGRFGKVYLGFDMETTDLVAIKMLRGMSFRYHLIDFFDEIRHLIFLLDCLNNETGLRATKILDFNFEGRLNGLRPVAYYTMEFIELGELYMLIERADLISEKLANHFIQQLVNNLRLLHSYKLYHFDIKPENVLINEQGELYICDFGSALNYKKPKDVNWKKVNFIGSFEYAAPEAYSLNAIKDIKGAYHHIKEYDLEKLDVFSLGVLAFVLVIKSKPFEKAQEHDPFYSRFINSHTSFWRIFEKVRSSSKNFKTFIESMIDPANSERNNIAAVKSHEWLAIGSNKTNVDSELQILIDQRKESFLTELKNSLELKLTKRKQITSNTKLLRYKNGEEVLKLFLIKNEKKIMKLRYEITEHKINQGRYSPSEVSSLSGNLSDEEF